MKIIFKRAKEHGHFIPFTNGYSGQTRFAGNFISMWTRWVFHDAFQISGTEL